MRHLAPLSLLAAALTMAAIPAFAATQTVQSGKRDILVQATQSWNGKPYVSYPKGKPELVQIRLTIAPDTVLPWHIHPFPNVGYVLHGTLTLHDRASGKTQVFHEGQSFAESVDDVHRGEAGPDGAVLLLTYAATPGRPTSIPAAGEKAEY